jgi:hypothetical protein
VSLIEGYRSLGSAALLDQQRAERIVGEAMPHAMATLGTAESLSVRVACTSAADARGGSVIPAWPLKQPDGGVVIEYVADWGALLAGWLSVVHTAQQALAQQLVREGQRIWIGIANDVIQLFVKDPPADQYSMVRHHALMLTAATTWLGVSAIEAWRAVHASAARTFLMRHADDSLWQAIAVAEAGLTELLRDGRARQPARRCIEWLDSDAVARERYEDFLGAASLGVAAILDALPASADMVGPWLAHATADLHQDPDFNREWLEASARRLLDQVEMRA